ncbi:lanthionine synthetase LanC family protein [Streptomyces sp. NPDC093225]|uniref:lanthionine synthetase LanC family protein n=1 Tax=Streptomyces sp. NPDC093225 TaxID=3366034 RepID=UPI0038110753
MESGTTFKLAADVSSVIRLNAGLAGHSQVGKIVTAYPVSDEVLVGLVDRLDAAWRPLGSPAVPSDLPAGSGGALFLRYGAFTGTEVVTDATGVIHAALRTPAGELSPDVRSTQGEQPRWAIPPMCVKDQAGCTPPGAPIEIDGVGYLPLKALAVDHRGRVDLGLRISDCTLIVIRRRMRGVEGDEFGNDAVSRLDNERRMLLRLHGSGIAHELVAHDPAAGCLVVTDAGGLKLEQLPVRRRLEELPNLAETVAKLHEYGLVHRDLKLSNMRLGPDALRLVDLELAAPAGKKEPISAGTPGYVAPEGMHSTVRPSYDVYSLGSCITHAVLGHCPGGLPQSNNAGRQTGMLRHYGLRTAASIVKECHNPDAERRPTARDLTDRLKDALPALQAESAAALGESPDALDVRWARSAAVSAGLASRWFRVGQDGTYHWNDPGRQAHVSEGVNRGVAGILLALAALDTALGTQQFTDDIRGAANWLAERPATIKAHGLFTGNSGVAVALALAGQRLGRTDLLHAAQRRFEYATSSRTLDYDLFSGAAGIVWAGRLLDAVLGTSWGCGLAEQQVERIRKAASRTGGVVGWPANLEYDSSGGVYIGAAHGTAGIAMALAGWAAATGCTNTMQLSREALQSIAEHGLTDDGSNIRATLSGTTLPAHTWCHGAAGYLWCLLQSSHDVAVPYTAILESFATKFDRAMPLLANPSMCHGVGGMLETWRMLRVLPSHRDQASHQIGSLIGMLRLLHHTYRGATVWSSDQPAIVTTDLWVGFLGPAVQLALAVNGSSASVISPDWLQRCASPPDGRARTAGSDGVRTASYENGKDRIVHGDQFAVWPK